MDLFITDSFVCYQVKPTKTKVSGRFMPNLPVRHSEKKLARDRTGLARSIFLANTKAFSHHKWNEYAEGNAKSHLNSRGCSSKYYCKYYWIIRELSTLVTTKSKWTILIFMGYCSICYKLNICANIVFLNSCGLIIFKINK